MQRHLELQDLLTSQKDRHRIHCCNSSVQKKAEVAKRSVTINVAIDPEKGEFVGRDDKYATITYTDLDEFAEAPILFTRSKG